MNHAARRDDFLVPRATPVAPPATPVALPATPVALPALALAFALAFALACSGCTSVCDTPDCDPPPSAQYTRGTIDSLVAIYFPHVYSNVDSAGYEEMLDDRYSFERLPSAEDEPGEDLFWDKFEELRIAGRMFKGFANPDGQSVQSIASNILVTETLASNDSDRPDDEAWFDVSAIVDMIVVVNDPSVTDGTGVTNFVINSNQDFIVTADRDSPGDWVVVQQVDREPIN